MAEPLVEIRNLAKHFPITKGIVRRRQVSEIRAVDGIDLTIHSGETLALVGESGCGKSTAGRLILGLLPPTDGAILHQGVDIAAMNPAQLRQMRSRFQMIFQDPFGSLNPRMTVRDLIAEPLKINGYGKAERLEKADALLEAVGLGSQHASRYPHEFSGGQRQRIGIARALALGPDLVVADEPVSALDVSVQAQVINLMQDLQQDLGLTYLFISHDLGIVHHIADRVAVMYLGRIVEVATKAALFASPAHPYTRALLDAIPVSRPDQRRPERALSGDLPDVASVVGGCRFAPRCPFATDRCRTEDPALRDLAAGHSVACHHAEALRADNSKPRI
ncbi:ABC transporter ATP-binding protein [Oceaniovalibus sp. ACAM 378]|uniref:ABC transporter ATP-binding protein n=1 Tax=Oceaniovalibus sp. ACAM 378 TaxID=2599923 RepID=UPI0011D387B1|nr:dipeptide ABC transporter ATP-binding protein [Oceaniovalibus sp. ACAM 378]TYB84540.1 dipeptide ABC transporter ATP-binding protein [Oceaniovalibus sp. ACAM 378]